MNLEAIKNLYEKNGFFWNAQLEALQTTYGGRDFTFCRKGQAVERVIRFDVSWCIELGRHGDVGMYDHIIYAIGEECAPVAEEDPVSYGIMWLLTVSGKLVGYHDFCIYRIGDPQESLVWWHFSTPLRRDCQGDCQCLGLFFV